MHGTGSQERRLRLPQGLGHAVVLAGGPLLGVLVFALVDPSALSPAGRATAAVAAWMALWWLTEAVPLAATAMLPLALFPLLGVGDARETAAPYASSIVFLFLGGFLIGIAMQRCGLHRRIALLVLGLAGSDTRRLIGAFMLATALLSMWISNTATVIMLLPIAASLLGEVRRGNGPPAPPGIEGVAAALMLGVAYAASIGGVATLIGTPPNLILAAFLRERYGIEVSMLQWLAVGLPFTVLMLPLAWLYVTRIVARGAPATLPGSRALFAQQRRALGPMSVAERVVLTVFLAAVCAWVLRPQIVALTGLQGLSDPVVAMTAALALFAIPVRLRPWTFALDWPSAKSLPWDVLLLFGGGLTLAAAIARHGVDGYLGSGIAGLGGASVLVVLLALTATVVFLTEITSNTAVTATLLPVVAAAASALGLAPGPLLVAVALSASCAFMLPVATPPNAIVFSSGHVTITQMARAGLALNVLCIVLVAALVSLGAGHGLLR
jgi:sodium-dependent dicarboxylate transporter 2/3/5